LEIQELDKVDVAHFVERPLEQQDLDCVLPMIANGGRLEWVVFAFRGPWWLEYLEAKGVVNYESVNVNSHSEFGQVAFVTVKVDEELRNSLVRNTTSQVRSLCVCRSVPHLWKFVLTTTTGLWSLLRERSEGVRRWEAMRQRIC